MTPVRLEPAVPRSRVKHSTTEPLPSLNSRSRYANLSRGKLSVFSYPPVLTCDLGAQKNCPIEMVLLLKIKYPQLMLWVRNKITNF